MNFLAFDTSTEVMSVAAGADARTVHVHAGAGGAQASFGLIATAQRLVREAGLTLGSLDAIVFGAGPGSFTGLRTACSVAQGLALGADLPVLPVNSLLAVAEDARLRHAPEALQLDVMTLLDARMDEVYAAHWHWNGQQWQARGDVQLCAPQSVEVPQTVQWLAGNVFAVYPGRVEQALGARALNCVAALPSAPALLSLAPSLLRQGLAVPPQQALPLYVRDKVARTTAEREQDKARQAAARESHGS